MPVAAKTLATSGDGAARRRDPPSSPARRRAGHQDRQAAGVRALDRGQVDDQLAGRRPEQAEEVLAQGGRRRDAQVPAERGDDATAAFGPGGQAEAGIMSREVDHSTSDHVSGDGRRGGGPPQRPRWPLLAAGWNAATEDGRAR